MFGANWNSDNTKENAFKHCLWNALAAYKIGVDKAREFGEAHEAGMMEFYPDSTKMDLYNNEMGYAIVQAPLQPWEYYAINYQSKYTTGDWKVYIIIDRVYRALESGELIYLE